MLKLYLSVIAFLLPHCSYFVYMIRRGRKSGVQRALKRVVERVIERGRFTSVRSKLSRRKFEYSLYR